MNWISLKNNYFIIFCGEIKKSKSDFFFDSFLEPEVQSTMNPLHWWLQSVTSAIPPRLLDMVQGLFVLPASTAGIERCFSTMGNIMTKQRNRLSVEKATKLCCINGFFKIQNSEKDRQNNNERYQRKRKFPESSVNE
jgi:hAT family protein